RLAGVFRYVHPDVAVAVADRGGKAVCDLILIRQEEIDLPIEGRIQIRRQCGVTCLSNGCRLDLDAREMAGVHDPKMRRFGDLPSKLGMITSTEQAESLGRRWTRGRQERQDDQSGTESRDGAHEVHEDVCRTW